MAGALAQLLYRVRAVVRPPVTLGVRLLVVDETQHVLLVRHSYSPGWHCPGGAVDPGESAREAALRETREETGLDVRVPVRLVGLYFNEGMGRRDHVALFAALGHPAIDRAALRPQALEIVEVRLAPLDDLPEDVSAGTRRRLAELASEAAPAEIW